MKTCEMTTISGDGSAEFPERDVVCGAPATHVYERDTLMCTKCATALQEHEPDFDIKPLEVASL